MASLLVFYLHTDFFCNCFIAYLFALIQNRYIKLTSFHFFMPKLISYYAAQGLGQWFFIAWRVMLHLLWTAKAGLTSQ